MTGKLQFAIAWSVLPLLMTISTAGLAAKQQSPLTLYKTQAEAGDSTAMVSLGSLYLTGNGVKKDEKKAFQWFENAARNRSVAGAYVTGVMLTRGTGTPPNALEGCKWLWIAANFGNKEAMLAMVDANIIADGRCMPKSEMQNWMQRSVDANHPPAFSMLGDFYEKGSVGFPKDVEKAKNLYRKGSELGDEKSRQALIRLGIK
jgi:uncharacterized protein